MYRYNETAITNIIISQWNNRITNSLIVNIIILVFFLILAIFGNVFVVLVYIFRMKKNTEERYYIPILSVFDLITATYCSSYMIYQCFNNVTFQNDGACKSLVFFVGFFTYIPILLLVLISAQRYVRLCMPKKTALSKAWKRSLVALCILVAFLLAMPLGFIFGTSPFTNAKLNITGSQCTLVTKGTSKVGIIYSIVLGIIVFTVFTVLIFFYSKIGVAVFTNYKTIVQMSKCKGGYRMNNTNRTSIDNTDDAFIKIQNSNYSKNHRTKPSHRERDPFSQLQASMTVQSGVEKSKLSNTNRRITYKLALVFLVITVVFCISFMPKVIVLAVNSVNKDFWEKLSDDERPVFMFLYQIHILNNIVNPFIYVVMDTRFRKEARMLLKNVF